MLGGDNLVAVQLPLFRTSEDGSSHNRGGLGSDILLSPHTPASSNSHDAWPSFKDTDKLHRFSSLTGSSGRNSCHIIDSQKLIGSMRRGESKFGNISSNSATASASSVNKNKATMTPSIPRLSPRAASVSPSQNAFQIQAVPYFVSKVSSYGLENAS